MSVNPIAAVAAGASQAAAALPARADVAAAQRFDVIPGLGELRTSPTSGAGGAFQSLLSAVNQVNSELVAGNQAVRSLALGNVENLHESMMTLEHAKLSLQLLLQVRNGVLDAYQELMRMQI